MRCFIEILIGMFSGSIVALITPFTDDNLIDYDCVASLIEWHIESGTHAIVLAGTTGESPTLSHDEKILLAKFAVNVAQKRIKIIVGNGSNNTAQSVALTQQLSELDIDGFLTVSPYYNKPNESGLLAHFTAIAKATTLPIILYNVPSRTQSDLSNELIAKLAELNNIIGLKDATADLSRVQPLRLLCGPNFKLFSGDDATALAYCLSGGDGVISVTANVAPVQIAEMQQCIKVHKIEQAKKIEQSLVALHKNLFIESNPIAVKWALCKLNRIKNANLRLPLMSLSERNQHLISQTMLDSGLFD